MAEITRQVLFGPGSRETIDDLIISKADMAVKGLVPAAINTPESMWLCLYLMAIDALTEQSQTNNPEQNITITEPFNNQSFVNRDNKSFRQVTYSTNLQQVDDNFVLDPKKF